MSQINYAAMSDQELKRHFLQHRDDKAALQAYLERLSNRPRNMITTVDDPEFEAKLQSVVLQQMHAEERGNGD